jgi:6-phosphofructokinase
MRMSQRKKLAILVGGGPAPGINSVIGAATIRAALEGNGSCTATSITSSRCRSPR